MQTCFFPPRNARFGAAFNLPCVELHMPCNSICLFYTKVMVGFVFYTKASPWTGLVIFPLAAPRCLRLPAAPSALPVENGGFFRSVYTAGGRQDLQIGSTNTEHNFFFQPAHSHSYHSRAIKVFKEASVLSENQTLSPLSSFCLCLFSIQVLL